jgi:hypothetical protein
LARARSAAAVAAGLRDLSGAPSAGTGLGCILRVDKSCSGNSGPEHAQPSLHCEGSSRPRGITNSPRPSGSGAFARPSVQSFLNFTKSPRFVQRAV